MSARRASSAAATAHGDAASGASTSNVTKTEYDEAVANLHPTDHEASISRKKQQDKQDFEAWALRLRDG